MSTRKITRKPAVTGNTLADTLRQFLTLKVQVDFLDKRVGDLKKALTKTVETEGYADDKGNFWLDLDDPLDVDGYGTCTQLKYERRVKTTVDEEAAEAVLKAKGLFDDCTTTITVLDEEEIRKAHYKGLLTDDDIEQIFPSSVSFAFIPQKVKS